MNEPASSSGTPGSSQAITRITGSVVSRANAQPAPARRIWPATWPRRRPITARPEPAIFRWLAGSRSLAAGSPSLVAGPESFAFAAGPILGGRLLAFAPAPVLRLRGAPTLRLRGRRPTFAFAAGAPPFAFAPGLPVLRPRPPHPWRRSSFGARSLTLRLRGRRPTLRLRGPLPTLRLRGRLPGVLAVPGIRGDPTGQKCLARLTCRIRPGAVPRRGAVGSSGTAGRTVSRAHGPTVDGAAGRSRRGHGPYGGMSPAKLTIPPGSDA